MCFMHVRRLKCGAHQPYEIIICREESNLPAEGGEGETGRMCRLYTFFVDQHLDEHCERCTREGLDRTKQEDFLCEEVLPQSEDFETCYEEVGAPANNPDLIPNLVDALTPDEADIQPAIAPEGVQRAGVRVLSPDHHRWILVRYDSYAAETGGMRISAAQLCNEVNQAFPGEEYTPYALFYRIDACGRLREKKNQHPVPRKSGRKATAVARNDTVNCCSALGGFEVI